jgi:hypothetical protein
MTDNLLALIGKALKDEEVQLDPGRYEYDEVVMVHVTGAVRKEADTTCSPTCSIPLIATLALFWEKSGIAQGPALRMLKEAICEALSTGKDTSAEIQDRIKHVEQAVKSVKDELLSKLPKQRRAGRLITKDLHVEVVAAHEKTLAPVAA